MVITIKLTEEEWKKYIESNEELNYLCIDVVELVENGEDYTIEEDTKTIIVKNEE